MSNTNLTIRQLITFREVMLSASITEAARALGRTQPAVSSMISGLENQLGFKLFIREHSRITATPEAHFFMEEVENVLYRLDQSQRTIEEIAHLEYGRLRIACMPAASSFLIPSLISRFIKDKPNVNISLMMRSSLVIDNLIASQKYDIGFAETPERRNSVNATDFKLECLCAIKKDDSLAENEIISPDLLDGTALATLFDSHPTYQQTVQRFELAGKSFIRQFELQTFLPALQLVETGQCYCICDMVSAYSYMKYSKHSSKITFRLFRPKVVNPVSLLTPAHRPQSLIAKDFYSRLVREIETMKGDILAACRI